MHVLVREVTGLHPPAATPDRGVTQVVVQSDQLAVELLQDQPQIPDAAANIPGTRVRVIHGGRAVLLIERGQTADARLQGLQLRLELLRIVIAKTRRAEIPDAEALHRAEDRLCSRRLRVHDGGNHHRRVESGLPGQLDRLSQITFDVFSEDVRAGTDRPCDPLASRLCGRRDPLFDAGPLQMARDQAQPRLLRRRDLPRGDHRGPCRSDQRDAAKQLQDVAT